MSVKLLVDMNLSVEWVTELTTHGWVAVHCLRSAIRLPKTQ